MTSPLDVADPVPLPNDLDAYWMPFSDNRGFKRHPRMLVAADGMYYRTAEGKKVLDGTAGLWCVNAGHRRPKIVEAVRRQVDTLDYAPSFNMGHPLAFELAARLKQLLPEGLDHVFFTNSGSESVDTALKIALAYHRAAGQGQRTRLIGRERGYHGVGFGGMSVGGIVANRRTFGPMLPGVDHLPHTHDPARNAFSKDQPAHGVEFADQLERLIALHDASTIAAVIVEPVAGSTGVLVPPAGYLQRLREITAKHGILLIFDEVITGYGRLGSAFATEYFGVTPDLIATAKGLTNGVIPMGAVFATRAIYDAITTPAAEGMIELFHGYTYSGHPIAAACGLATLDTYREEDLFQRARNLSPYWRDAMHSLQDARHVVDIRNLGLVAGIELEPRPGQPTKRAVETFQRAFDAGVLVRTTGDTIALSPPLIIEKPEIDRIVDTVRDCLALAA
jgi:beta-alanine--pyruvate transaminase